MILARRPLMAVVSVACLLAAWWAGHPGQEQFAVSSSASLAPLVGLHLPFIANQGQADNRIAYYAPTFAGTVFVTRDGTLVYSLPAKSRRGSLPQADADQTSNAPGGWTLTESFVGGTARPVAGAEAAANVSYFVGNDPKRWRPRVPSHVKIALGEVWPGIAVDVKAYGRHVEKLFTVAPGADVAAIRMRVDGATRHSIADDGALMLATGIGEVRLTAPVAWQENDGTRIPVPVAYALRAGEYGFTLGVHDPALPVVIDPLLQSTYLGGSGPNENVNAIAIHPVTGEIYVAGRTGSNDFPGTAGGAQPFTGSPDFTTDAFVARFNANLTVLLQATYLGGLTNDQADSLAISTTTGDVYVAGTTSSNNFPGTAGGAQPALAVGAGTPSDAFIARLNANLTTLIQSTYLGGTGLEPGAKIAIHPTSGEVYVAGPTNSSNFPGTTGGAQPANPGVGTFHGYVARLNANLTALNQATYFGGTSTDQIFALAIHPAIGEAYIAGNTASTNLLNITGAAQPASGGSTDAFVARLNANLTAINQTTYFGGSNIDTGVAMIIHPTSGEVYLTGLAISTDVPGTTGGAQPTSGGGSDSYLARFSANLTAPLLQATYLGGSASDSSLTLAVHPTSGEVYVAGSTSSVDFPGTTGGAQSASAGVNDAFIVRLNTGLTAFNQATYLGGSNVDNGIALAIHPGTGEVYLTGDTSSTDLPVATGGAQATINGLTDIFVARVSADLLAVSSDADLAITKTDSPDPVIVGSNLTYTITVTNNGPAAATGVTVTDALPAGVTFVSTTPSQGSCSVSVLNVVTCNLGGLANAASATIAVVVTPNAVGALSNTATVTAVETDPNAANNSATASSTVVAVTADLGITVTDAPDPANVGSNLGYTITLTNNGPSAATGITVTDVLPAGVAFVSSTPSQGSCSGTLTVICNLGGLANAANATITVVVTPSAVGALSNTTTVTAVETDPNAANNSATATTTVNAANADLAVTVNATPNPASVNGTLTYTVQVTNNGPSSASGVTLTSDLTGTGFTFVSISPSQGSCVGTTTATCTLGTVANGASASVTIVATPTAVGTVTLTAAVTATEPDVNAANDNALLAVSAINTVCSNGTQGVATTNTSGSLVAGCVATVGPASGGGGGGSVGTTALTLLLLLTLGRRIAAVRGRPRGGAP